MQKLLCKISEIARKCNSLEQIQDLMQSVSVNQFASKEWLTENLLNFYSPQHALVLGSWYNSILPELMQATYFTCIDIDIDAVKLGRMLNPERCTFITGHAQDYMRVTDISIYDTIINCSCEHMIDFKHMYKEGPVYALQSNNYYGIDGHINCKKDLNEFIESTGLQNILFADNLQREKYKRFMVIGQ